MRFEDLWAARDTTPRATAEAPAPTSDTDGARRYALAALARENATLASTGEGSRNHQLNISAFNCGQLLAHISEQEITETLSATAAAIGLAPSEIRATIASGISSGRKLPRIIPQSAFEQVEVAEVDAADLLDDRERSQIDGFWDARRVLNHIRHFAYSRMTSPWAVLGGCLLRAVGAVPPFVVLPPTIGGVGSINLLVGLIGPSGAGKGASEAAAADALTWPSQATAPLGSGEGITHAYAKPRPVKKDDPDPDPDPLIWITKSIIFTAPEVDQVAAIKDRRGSTLMGMLRSAYSGERLGFQYADQTRRIILPPHAYRFGLSVGIQPDRAGWLLDEADGGTPQRFLWLPVTDKNITATPPFEPAPWPWTAPMAIVERIPGARRDNHGRVVLPIPPVVMATIRQAHAARARGEGEALDGHALYTRLKVAQALALLDERYVMTVEDWDLAGTVMALSDATRTRIQSRLRQRADAADDARARRDAKRQVITEETYLEEAIKRVARTVSKAVRKSSAMPRSAARRAVMSKDREHFDDALAKLIDAGQIRVEESEHGEVLTWVAD